MLRGTNFPTLITQTIQKPEPKPNLRCRLPKPITIRGRGTGEPGEAGASPEFRGFTTEKFLASWIYEGGSFSCFTGKKTRSAAPVFCGMFCYFWSVLCSLIRTGNRKGKRDLYFYHFSKFLNIFLMLLYLPKPKKD